MKILPKSFHLQHLSFSKKDYKKHTAWYTTIFEWDFSRYNILYLSLLSILGKYTQEKYSLVLCYLISISDKINYSKINNYNINNFYNINNNATLYALYLLEFILL